MKRLWNVLLLTLAMNFLAVAGVVGWLYQGGPVEPRAGEPDQGCFISATTCPGRGKHPACRRSDNPPDARA